MGPSNLWPDPKAPLPNLTLPVTMGPMTIPERKRKRRWTLFALWTLLVFTGGVAASPYLIDVGCDAIEKVASILGMQTPQFVAKRKLSPGPTTVPLPTLGGPAAPAMPTNIEKATAGEVPSKAPTVTVEPIKPSASPEAQKAVPIRPVAIEPPPVRPAVTALPDQKVVAAAEPVRSRPSSSRGGSKLPSSKGAGPKKKGADDPFDTGDDGPGESAPAAASAKPVAAASAKPTAAAAPIAKPTASKSNDPLDSLMANIGSEGSSSGKSKKHQSKEIDDMLKDVQKANKAEPVAKREPEASAAPALTSSDISKAMAVLKTRSSECAQHLGSSGTAQLKITVGKDGRVTKVNVGGKVAGTPLGGCIEKAAKASSFPPNAGLTFDYRIDAR
jgi:hypothetical protein